MAYNFLIVDDSSVVRKVLLRTLSMTSLECNEVLQAENGKDALDKLRGAWVDLIFLDVNMPIMNGVQFMEELSKDETLRLIPVVVVSTEGSQERIKRLEELGVRAYLRKPTTPEALVNCVEGLLHPAGKLGGTPA